MHRKICENNFMQAVTITQITPQELESLIQNAVHSVIGIKSIQPQEVQDELLTVQQAGKFLSLSVPTIYGLIHRNQLPVMKRSKRCYFSKKELLEYLKKGRKQTNEDLIKETDAYLSGLKKKGGAK